MREKDFPIFTGTTFSLTNFIPQNEKLEVQKYLPSFLYWRKRVCSQAAVITYLLRTVVIEGIVLFAFQPLDLDLSTTMDVTLGF